MNFFTVLCALVAAVAADVSHLPSNQYLPPTQDYYGSSGSNAGYGSAPLSFNVESASGLAASYPFSNIPSYQDQSADFPDSVAYSAPSTSFDTFGPEPAHSFSPSEGYRYKTNRRRVYRRRVRRDVSHLSNDYLPPFQDSGSALSGEYLPPVSNYSPVGQYESGPDSFSSVSYSAPSASFDFGSSEGGHSYSPVDGYRYKTAKRRVIRRRRF